MSNTNAPAVKLADVVETATPTLPLLPLAVNGKPAVLAREGKPDLAIARRGDTGPLTLCKASVKRETDPATGKVTESVKWSPTAVLADVSAAVTGSLIG